MCFITIVDLVCGGVSDKPEHLVKDVCITRAWSQYFCNIQTSYRLRVYQEVYVTHAPISEVPVSLSRQVGWGLGAKGTWGLWPLAIGELTHEGYDLHLWAPDYPCQPHCPS